MILVLFFEKNSILMRLYHCLHDLRVGTIKLVEWNHWVIDQNFHILLETLSRTIQRKKKKTIVHVIYYNKISFHIKVNIHY